MSMHGLSDQQRALRDAVGQFARRELAPGAAARDRDADLPEAVVGRLAVVAVRLRAEVVEDLTVGAARANVS